MTGGMVISSEMYERKWVIADLNQTMSVKEQRVDGSSVSSDAVRCTLVAGKPVFEQNSYKKVNIEYRGVLHNQRAPFYPSLPVGGGG
jgi:hypothetical protein